MKSFSVTAAAVLFCFSMSVAAEQPASKPDPMTQAVKSVKKNLQQQPNNQGLQGAFNKIIANREDFRDRRSDKTLGNASRIEKADRPDRVDRVDAQAIADLPGRSELARGRRK